MTDTSHSMSQTEVNAYCRECGSPMVLKRIVPTKYHYKGKFECWGCGRAVTKAIKLAQSSSPPLASELL
jgi:uncharacterized Zn finger protein